MAAFVPGGMNAPFDMTAHRWPQEDETSIPWMFKVKSQKKYSDLDAVEVLRKKCAATAQKEKITSFHAMLISVQEDQERTRILGWKVNNEENLRIVVLISGKSTYK